MCMVLSLLPSDDTVQNFKSNLAAWLSRWSTVLKPNGWGKHKLWQIQRTWTLKLSMKPNQVTFLGMTNMLKASDIWQLPLKFSWTFGEGKDIIHGQDLWNCEPKILPAVYYQCMYLYKKGVMSRKSLLSLPWCPAKELLNTLVFFSVKRSASEPWWCQWDCHSESSLRGLPLSWR